MNGFCIHCGAMLASGGRCPVCTRLKTAPPPLPTPQASIPMGSVWKLSGGARVFRATGMVLGLLLLAVIFLVLFAPLGLALLGVAVIAGFAPAYGGYCPYCGSLAAPGGPGSVKKCIRCKHRYAHQGGRLLRTD